MRPMVDQLDWRPIGGIKPFKTVLQYFKFSISKWCAKSLYPRCVWRKTNPFNDRRLDRLVTRNQDMKC